MTCGTQGGGGLRPRPLVFIVHCSRREICSIRISPRAVRALRKIPPAVDGGAGVKLIGEGNGVGSTFAVKASGTSGTLCDDPMPRFYPLWLVQGAARGVFLTREGNYAEGKNKGMGAGYLSR